MTVRRLGRDGLHSTVEVVDRPMPRGPETNAWIRTPEGDWTPIGHVLTVDLKIDVAPLSAAFRKLGEQFAILRQLAVSTLPAMRQVVALAAEVEHQKAIEAWRGGSLEIQYTLAPGAYESLWEIISGQPYFGPRQYRRGLWVALVLVLVGVLAIALVGRPTAS